MGCVVLVGGFRSITTASPPPPWATSLDYQPHEIVDISIGRYGYPYFTIEINDHPVEVFLDTGNMTGLFLSKHTIDMLALPVLRETTRRDSNGKAIGTTPVYAAEAVAAFGGRWAEVEVIQRDVPGANGAIGPAYLLGKRFTLDYTRERLAVSTRSLETLPPDAVVLEMLPVEGLEGMIVVEGSLAGEKVLIQIDTGKSRCCIDPEFGARTGLPKSQGGFRVEDLRLGSFTFSASSAKPVGFRGISRGLDRSITIGMGSDMLKDVLMTVDYHRGVVMLMKP